MSEVEIRENAFIYYTRFLILGIFGSVIFILCRDYQYIPQYVSGYILIGCLGAAVTLAYGDYTWKAREKYRRE